LQIVKPEFHPPVGRGGKKLPVSSKIVIPVQQQSNKISIKAGSFKVNNKDSEDEDDVALSLSEDEDDDLSSVESDEEDELLAGIGKRNNLIRIGAASAID